MGELRSAVSRRRIIAAAAAAPVLASPLGRALAQAPEPVPTWPTEFKRLLPNVYAYIHGGGPRVPNATLANAGVLVGPDNVTLVDALGPPVQAHRLQDAVRSVTDKPVTRIINTHHHRDHTNGDYLFAPAEIVMTPEMRDLLVKQGIPAHPFPDRPEFQDRLSELKLALPTTLITAETTYLLGDIEAHVLVPGRGHTFGDLMVYLPKNRLLFAGDIASFYVTPGLHNGDAEHWLAICDEIQKMDVEVIVPGHGPIGGKRELADMANYIRLMRDGIRKGYDAGKTPGRAAAEAPIGHYADWSEPNRMAWAAARLYAVWNGTAKPEQDVAAQDKAEAEYRAIRAAAR